MSWSINNNKPIYMQLVEQLKYKIISGEFEAGEKIDSVRNLAQEAQVNPNTMQKALVELEREALVFSKRTSGRFVTDDKDKIESMKKELANEEIKTLKNNLERLGFSKDEIIDFVICHIKEEN